MKCGISTGRTSRLQQGGEYSLASLCIFLQTAAVFLHAAQEPASQHMGTLAQLRSLQN